MSFGVDCGAIPECRMGVNTFRRAATTMMEIHKVCISQIMSSFQNLMLQGAASLLPCRRLPHSFACLHLAYQGGQEAIAPSELP
jgi:hypothetical protein